MRYLVKARIKPGREASLARAIHDKTLGRGSIAGDEYLWDMEKARGDVNHEVTWVEVCFCREPLAEERPYWEEYFELLSVKEAHARRNCRDLNVSRSAEIHANTIHSRSSGTPVATLIYNPKNSELGCL